MATTMLENMVDPQVLADMISAELENAIRFSPLAVVDRSLVGNPGSTVTVPKFKYIGDAEDVAEGAAIDLTLLETSTAQCKVKKAAKGVEITDEAMLSGFGDPIGEAGKQLLMAVSSKVDNDVMDALGTTKLVYTAGTTWNLDTISGALDIFNDEDEEAVVLVMNPLDASALRKSVANDWDRASDMGDDVILRGTYGGVLGAQVIRSRKLPEGTAYLVKQGALAIYLKRAVAVESDRDITRKVTIITADEHYGTHLYDESKAVKIEVTAGGGAEG